MELLAVMAIMGILSTMAVTGYFSAVRGMTRRRAVSNLVAAINQARQRASIDGTRTALICYNIKNTVKDAADINDTTTFSPTYVVCKALGRVTYVSGTTIGDEFTPLDKIFGAYSASSSDSSFGSRRLYNLSREGWWEVEDTVKLGAYGNNLKSGLTGENLPTSEMLWCFTKMSGDGASWNVGDLYGIEVSPPEILPKNIYFGGDLKADDKQNIKVLFDSDGCPKDEKGNKKSFVIELCGKATQTAFATITVNTDGSVTGWEPGKVDLLK